jgi:hypothetical protein
VKSVAFASFNEQIASVASVVKVNLQPSAPVIVLTIAVPVIPTGNLALKRPHYTVEKTELPALYQILETPSKPIDLYV